jgi:hypothetical protein
MTAGQFAVASFQFIGIYNAPDNTALSGTFTVANQAAAIEVNDTNVTTATFHGVASSRIESFDLASKQRAALQRNSFQPRGVDYKPCSWWHCCD